jgi:NAD(P)-dependent dehydrogenase (short-subunit alcohol dehydrogenase family)
LLLPSLDSRHIVITGASRGIGKGAAMACAAAGARLTICARRQEALEPVAAATGAVGGALDVRDEAAVETWLEAGVRHHGPIDALINNAAIIGPISPVSDYPLTMWREVMDINVAGPLVVTRKCLPRMARHSLVLFLTSYLGRHALPGFGAYCASKFAVEGLTRLFAEEHRERGLVSVAVDPGMVQTDMLAVALQGGDVSEHPTPERAGAAFVRLLTSLDSEHTGTTVDLF